MFLKQIRNLRLEMWLSLIDRQIRCLTLVDIKEVFSQALCVWFHSAARTRKFRRTKHLVGLAGSKSDVHEDIFDETFEESLHWAYQVLSTELDRFGSRFRPATIIVVVPPKEALQVLLYHCLVCPLKYRYFQAAVSHPDEMEKSRFPYHFHVLVVPKNRKPYITLWHGMMWYDGMIRFPTN